MLTDDRFGDIVQPRFDAIVAQHSTDFRDVKRAISECHTVGSIESLGEHHRFFVLLAAARLNRIYLACFLSADE